MSTELLVDDPAPGVRRLTLNRPGSLNALSRALVAELRSTLDALDRDDTVRAVVLRGAGRAFCAGADLGEHFVAGDEPSDIGTSGLWERLETLRVPVVAAVHGWAVTGGFLLAYSCDLVVAAEDAVFRDTHAALGLLPTGGESQRLPRRVGQFLARELMLTSRPFPAAEAHAAGLVNRVVPRGRLDEAALELAGQVAANSPRSVAAIKRLINGAAAADLAAGLRMELLVNDFGRANRAPDPEREARLAARPERS
jgi:enoyl-CoA hydratase/carnithine racemase